MALTLRSVAGLTVPEIARAFLSSESAMERRLVRARRKVLARLVSVRMPDTAEVLGLLALLLLTDARRAARTGADGALVSLEDQGPLGVDTDRAGGGVRVLERALRHSRQQSHCPRTRPSGRRSSAGATGSALARPRGRRGAT